MAASITTGSTTSNSASSCNSGSGGAGGGMAYAAGAAASSCSNNNTSSSSTGGGGGTGTQACAACKFQRRKCSSECPLAPYFPPDQPKQFLNVHKLYGVSNTLRILKQVQPSKRNDAMKSILYEADARDRDPVHGCLGIITFLHTQAQLLRDELDFVRSQIHLLEHAHLQLHSPLAVAPPSVPPPSTSVSLYPHLQQQPSPLSPSLHPVLIPSELQLASPASTINATASPDSTCSAAYLHHHHHHHHSDSPVGYHIHPLTSSTPDNASATVHNAYGVGNLHLHCGSPTSSAAMAAAGGGPAQLFLNNSHLQQQQPSQSWQQQLSPGSAQVNGWLAYHYGGRGQQQQQQQHALPQLLPGTPTDPSGMMAKQLRKPSANLIDVRPSFDTRSLADYEPLAQLHSYHDSAPKAETAYESSAESSIKDQNSLEHDELESAAALFALTSGQIN